MAVHEFSPSTMSAVDPGDATARLIGVTESLGISAAGDVVQAEWDTDRAVTALYSQHYGRLVHWATLLVDDVGTAEDVVQDAFVALHSWWARLRDGEEALSYLRRFVADRARSVLSRRMTTDWSAPAALPDMPSAEYGAITQLERSAVVAALRTLPSRQREAVVLRYYGDFSEAEIAHAMRISRGAVKSHTSRAMAALRNILEIDTDEMESDSDRLRHEARASDTNLASRQSLAPTSVVDELSKLGGMLDSGLLTRGEFDRLKAGLIAEH